jgi:hypothetical protein
MCVQTAMSYGLCIPFLEAISGSVLLSQSIAVLVLPHITIPHNLIIFSMERTWLLRLVSLVSLPKRSHSPDPAQPILLSCAFLRPRAASRVHPSRLLTKHIRLSSFLLCGLGAYDRLHNSLTSISSIYVLAES